MEDTVEELVTKHTRRELEEMAVALGLESLGGTKAQLAEMILESRNKSAPKAAKEPPKEKPVAEKPKEAAPPMPKETLVKSETPLRSAFGKHGVLAKSNSIDQMSGELQKAGRSIRDEGMREMMKGVSDFKRATDAQIAENRKAASKMRTGMRQLKFESEKKALGIQKAGVEMRESGIRAHQNRVNQFMGDLNVQIRENMDAASKFQAGAGEIRTATDKMAVAFSKAGSDMRESGIRSLQNGLKQFNSDLNAQIRENKDAASKLQAGAGEIHNATDKMAADFQNKGMQMREDGARALQKGLSRFKSDLNSQIRENIEAAGKIGAGARELKSRAASYHQEIQRYHDQDLTSYVRAFYYG
jgi:hypothetical protein